jgi:glyoxylase-like metal-dependent hydrolase (beta-lactamase superfamily II)/rhodanese-related sulfurtransferase
MTDSPVYFRQFYLGCLAQASYLIGSEGVAAVVDPRRDIEVYLEDAAEHGLEIRHVIETHLHADFVSGHRELAAATGATIHVSRAANATYPHDPIGEGSEIRVGGARLRVLETPGHTRDSVCLLLFETPGAPEPAAVLTGDTLFIGDVGRPDLAGVAASPREQAGELYDSLHGKLLKLPDPVVVWPGHGAGSMCGRNLSKETSSTIGEQRRVNYALQPMDREAFVDMMTTDLPEIPAYFGRDVRINREGPALVSELAPLRSLSPEETARRAGEGALVLDARSSAEFGTAHVPGSIHIGLDGQFASWAGTLLPAGTPIVLVTSAAQDAEEARMRLTRVGLDDVAGYLAGGIASWSASGRPVASTEQITVDELAARLSEGSCRVLDVRRPAEWRDAHIAGAAPGPLADLGAALPEVPAEEPLALICAGGYRSSIAASLFERGGRRAVINVVGGMAAWNAAGLPTVA